jgi:hypothetical protein
LKNFISTNFITKPTGENSLKEGLTFEDGVLLCKHIYQCAIEKTLQGVREQDEIFYKTHDMLSTINKNHNHERLDELLYMFNIENVYATI